MGSKMISPIQLIYTPVIPINTNPLVWGPNGDKFDPLRWIEPGRLPPQNELTGGVNGHYAFFEGPRMCVGYRLG